MMDDYIAVTEGNKLVIILQAPLSTYQEPMHSKNSNSNFNKLFKYNQ